MLLIASNRVAIQTVPSIALLELQFIGLKSENVEKISDQN
jgi:hypothetical protein